MAGGVAVAVAGGGGGGGGDGGGLLDGLVDGLVHSALFGGAAGGMLFGGSSISDERCSEGGNGGNGGGGGGSEAAYDRALPPHALEADEQAPAEVVAHENPGGGGGGAVGASGDGFDADADDDNGGGIGDKSDKAGDDAGRAFALRVAPPQRTAGQQAVPRMVDSHTQVGASAEWLRRDEELKQAAAARQAVAAAVAVAAVQTDGEEAGGPWPRAPDAGVPDVAGGAGCGAVAVAPSVVGADDPVAETLRANIEMFERALRARQQQQQRR